MISTLHRNVAKSVTRQVNSFGRRSTRQNLTLRASASKMTVSPPTLTEKPTFFWNWYCPYVQRVWIALQAKGVEYDEFHIDLAGPRPDWYLELNPQGKVPLIGYKEGSKQYALNESLLLLEWVEEYQQKGNSLLPGSAGDKTRARLIAARFDTKLVPLWYKLTRSSSKEEAHAVAKEMKDELTWLQSQLDPHGPYALGAELSYVDAAIVPWFTRAFLLKHFRGLDVFKDFPKLLAYKEAVEAHPAVQATIRPPHGADFHKGLIEAYGKYGGEPINYFD